MPLYQRTRVPTAYQWVPCAYQLRDAALDAGALWDQYVQCAVVEDLTRQPRVLRVL